MHRPLITRRSRRCFSTGQCLSRRRGNHNYLAWAIVAGLGALALATVAAQGVTGRADAKTDAFHAEILNLAEQIRSRYYGDYTRFTASTSGSAALMATLKMVPGEWIQGGNAVTPWGGVLQAASVSATTFQIEVTNSGATPAVPMSACSFILNKLSNTNGVADFGAVGGSALGTNAITYDQATTLCSGTGAYVVFQ